MKRRISFRLGAEIAEKRAHKEPSAFGDALDVAGDQRGRFVDLLDLLHWEAAHMERPVAFREYTEHLYFLADFVFTLLFPSGHP